ncbi:MAG: GIY-YIG nuclease family protein [bacterium]
MGFRSITSYYTGNTQNLQKRIAEHQNGVFTGYTFDKRPQLSNNSRTIAPSVSFV